MTKEQKSIYNKAYQHALSPEKRGQYNAARRDKNKEYCRMWRKLYPAKNRAKRAFERAVKAQATPPWLTEAQKAEIRQIYAPCPAGYEVDHIVPLKGETARGLHVPWNLQYLTSRQNKSKRNSLVTYEN